MISLTSLLLEILENDAEHEKVLRATGFWGKRGAGCIFLAKDTKRILLPYRSDQVEEPHTWGVWGGAIDNAESPRDAVAREVKEETGYFGQLKLVPLTVFSKGTFKYHNFLAVVEHEFEPNLNWETEKFVWANYGEWPSPMHFGLEHLLKASGTEIEKIIATSSDEKTT